MTTEPETLTMPSGRRYRNFTYAERWSSVGRTAVTYTCPWCGTTIEAYLWSLCGSGKRCTNTACRSLAHGSGVAYEPEPKPRRVTVEDHALLALCDWTDTDEGGWHTSEPEALYGKGLSLRQFTAALGRLRVKGLVDCAEWHPGQGGAAREWLWFPNEAGEKRAAEIRHQTQGDPS